MSRLFSWLLFSLVTIHGFAWAAEAVRLIHRNSPDFRRCNPCPLTPKNQPPFLFGYSPLQAKGQHQSHFELMLNKSRFNIATDKMDMEEPFPFYQMKFLPDYGLDTYGIPSSPGRSDSPYHYFMRQGDTFRYLGHFPRLSYDRERKLFTASEKDGSRYRSSFYRLKENELLPVRVPKARIQGVPLVTSDRASNAPITTPSENQPLEAQALEAKVEDVTPVISNMASKASNTAPTPQVTTGVTGSSNNSDLSSSSFLENRPPQAQALEAKSEGDSLLKFLSHSVSVVLNFFEDNQLDPSLDSSPEGGPHLLDSMLSAEPDGNAPLPTQSITDINRRIDRLLAPPKEDACVDERDSDRVGALSEDERLRDVIACASGQFYGFTSPARRRLLQFLTPGLEQKFRLYQVDSPTQKSHLLAQMMYESAGFMATAEGRLAKKPWLDALNNREGEGSCAKEYATAIKSDKIHFDSYNRQSRNTYKSTYRGRGFIQLTHCYNYVAFFRHKAALEKLSEPNLSASERKKFKAISQDSKYLERESFCRAIAAGPSCNTSFCSSDQMKNMAAYLKKEEGLEIKPPELLGDFEATLDILAAPCHANKVSAMTSREFIIDSGLWYWQRCQKNYFPYINQDSDQAVQYISKCVHGNRRYLDLENVDSLCAEKSSSDKSDWIVQSYCGRRELFQALRSCFNQVPLAEKN